MQSGINIPINACLQCSVLSAIENQNICDLRYLVVTEDGEQLDARRQHGVPAVVLDPGGHLVLGTNPRFCLYPDVSPLLFRLKQ